MSGLAGWNWYDIADFLLRCATVLVVTGIAYAFIMLALSRRRPERGNAERGNVKLDDSSQEPPFVVFVLPCLNEAKVITASLDRLLRLPYQHKAILIVDDGSDDGTADLVSAAGDGQVHLLRRTPPDCRQGKGAALNAAVSLLVTSDLLAGMDPRNVVVAVLDADG